MTMDLTGKVKPCPMCGSERIYIPYPEIDVFYSVYIRCADCGLTGYKSALKSVDVQDAMERAINYWNTRA